ncbi:MAG: hypothetical protein A2Y17_01380 [Clostridiales bacterium GWF2_38_85]|nr:MAG: hypothetical protein A2Y17_01380 [Clostridiales bacterium GWF2_38_85]HBL85172.1 hypothetical protein [Clostridiales bacterium]
MSKYFQLLRYEIKTIYRDGFQLYLLAFPLVLLALSVFVFPRIFDIIGTDEAALRYTTLIMIIMLISFGTFLIGAMGSFLLLEHKDERTISTISVTPMGLSGYLRFKIIYIYVFAVISILIVLFGIKQFAADEYIIGGVSLFESIEAWHILTYALIAGMFAPTLALFQASFAKNKVEGFALMKMSSMAAMIPIIMILNTFKDGLQYVLGIFPNFWSIKGLMNELYPFESSANLPYVGYLAGGVVMSLLILVICYRMFLKKVNY